MEQVGGGAFSAEDERRLRRALSALNRINWQYPGSLKITQDKHGVVRATGMIQ